MVGIYGRHWFILHTVYNKRFYYYPTNTDISVKYLNYGVNGSFSASLVPANVGDCGKSERNNGAMEFSNIGARKGPYDAIKL